MKVAVIACTGSEILSSCRITASNLSKDGHKIYAIIAKSDSSASSAQNATDQKSLADLGVNQTFLIDTFDYSAITQANADAVNVYIKEIKPSLVIMPWWKSRNYMRRILSRASLIACRGIGTIWMYEPETTNNPDFNPTVMFEIAVGHPPIQHTNTILETTSPPNVVVQDEMDMEKNKTSAADSKSENEHSKTMSSELIKETFESHRTLLLENDGLF